MKALNLTNKSGACPDHSRGGYTIIETMIAVSLFLIIVVAGIGALLNANLAHNKSSDMRSIMDNLTFIMEDISRNARTGYDYRCYTGPLSFSDPEISTPQSCFNGWAIAFEESHGDNLSTNDQWVYKIESVGGDPFAIYKSTEGGAKGTFYKISDSAVRISPDSTFSVLGAEHPGDTLGLTGDRQQPLITVKLMGEIEYKGIMTPFSLQTSITQRLIDVTP